RAIPKVDPQGAVHDDEALVGVLVVVPDEVAFQLDDLELVVVHLRHHLRRPLLREKRELMLEIDRLMGHRRCQFKIAPGATAWSAARARLRTESSSTRNSGRRACRSACSGPFRWAYRRARNRACSAPRAA